MTAPDGMRAVKHAGALQCALSAAAKACASYRMGLTRIGDDALLSASEMITVAFRAGRPAPSPWPSCWTRWSPSATPPSSRPSSPG